MGREKHLDGKYMLGRMWRIFANLSMQIKLLIVFLFLISLPITAVSYLSFQDYSRSFKTNTTAYALEIATKTLTKLDDYITDLYSISTMPLYNEDFLNDVADPIIGLNKLNRLDLFIMNLNRIKEDTASVYVFDQYGHTFYNIKSGGKRDNLDEVSQMWSEIARQGDGSPVLVSTQEVSTDKSTYYAFTVIRSLKELAYMTPIGFIAFDTNISAIKNSIQDMDAVTRGKTILVDENNRVVFDSEQIMIAMDLSNDASIMKSKDEQGAFQIVIDNKSYLCTYVVSKLTGWKMLVYIPLEEVMHQATSIRNITIWTTVIIIGIALVASIAISYALTLPLRKIKFLMREVQHGKLNVRFNVKYMDEVGSLGRHFNIMLQRVQDLLEEVKFNQTRKKEAEFNMLQSQINPHFIYNTLETIRMTAEFNDDVEVAEMTFTLGKLLRYGINRGNEIVTVREELVHLKNYIALQNFRFSNRFELQINIPEHLYHYQCIKLMFQPIVENSINHAYKHSASMGTIIIHAEQEEDLLRFIVTDDGAGMDEDTLKTTRERIAGTRIKDSDRGIGLHNVNERIKIHYGSLYGLQVESELGHGSAITLLLPTLGVRHAERDDRG